MQPSQGDLRVANILLGSWSVFAVVGVAFFQFGVSISQARESKWENFARTLPTGGAAKLVAQVASAAIFLALSVGLLWTIALLFTAVDLSAVRLLKLFAVVIVGSVPFIFLGAALGYAVPPRGAVPIANLIYLPLSYLGGLWMPPSMLPDIVNNISRWTPTRQLGELAWATVQNQPYPGFAVLGLIAYGLCGLVIALFLWRKDETLRFA